MKTPAYQEFKSMTWEEIQPLYQQLQEIDLSEDSVVFWMGKWSDLRKLVDERYARLELAAAIDTTDEEAEREYLDFMEQIYPPTESADQILKEKGISLRLVQRLPIQSRAFFLARGFNKQQAEIIAQSCIFQTVFKNTSNKASSPSPLA